MVNWLLSEPEKEAVSNWESKTEDYSVSTRVLNPFWNLVTSLIPLSVPPNTISLAGLLCTVQAWYVCYRYIDSRPRLISVVASLLIFCYQTLDAVDGKQARRTGNESPVGELFDHACDNVGVVFVCLVGCRVAGLEDLEAQWYAVQISSLLLLMNHIGALKSGILRYGVLTGPGEFIFLFEVFLLSRAVFGLQGILEPLRVHILPLLIPYSNTEDPLIITRMVFRSVYYGVLSLAILRSLILPRKFGASKFCLLFCLCFRAAPAALMYLRLIETTGPELIEVIADGLFLSIVGTDLVVAKMSGRDLHPWLMLAVMVSFFSYLSTATVVAAYYVTVFFEICQYMHLPLFSLVTNVYVDGVYDLCHVGHHNIFTNALKHGNRLFVGVLSDEDVAGYKRKPIMTTKERMQVVATCKGVYKVISPCPYPGIPMEFLKKHNIHVVCCSPEYDKPDDIYYAVPRQLGILKVLPRTDGVSTSDLIRRVKAYEGKNKQVF